MGEEAGGTAEQLSGDKETGVVSELCEPPACLPRASSASHLPWQLVSVLTHFQAHHLRRQSTPVAPGWAATAHGFNVGRPQCYGAMIYGMQHQSAM